MQFLKSIGIGSFILATGLLSGCLETMQVDLQQITKPQQTALPTTGNDQSIKVAESLKAGPTPVKKTTTLVQQETAKAYRTSLPAADSQVASRSVDKTTSSSRGKEITCSPAVLRPGETLVIKTSKPFPFAAVIQPKKEYLFLVADDYPEGLTDQRTFQQLRTLEIRSDAKVKPNKPVFTVPGVYTFMVSKNLETDDGTPKFECKVQFLPK